MELLLLLKALGEPTRFSIFQQLLEKKHCVRSLSKKLGITESAVSQHMKVLRKTGLVYGEKYGYHRHYLPNQNAFDFLKGEIEKMRRQSQESYANASSETGRQMNISLDLFLTFAKIGLFTFGGGYAMISLIENTCAEKKRWITHDDMMNVTVITESTPGPIAINCATFIGYKLKGLLGAVLATIGMILPSFCIIFPISMFLDNFLEIRWIAHAFQGIKIAVGISILDAAIKMIAKMQKKPSLVSLCLVPLPQCYL